VATWWKHAVIGHLAPAEAGARTQTASAIRVERPRVGSTGATAPIRQLALFGLDHRFNEAEIPAGHFQPTRWTPGLEKLLHIQLSVKSDFHTKFVSRGLTPVIAIGQYCHHQSYSKYCYLTSSTSAVASARLPGRRGRGVPGFDRHRVRRQELRHE
jgi:hypothetical protein